MLCNIKNILSNEKYQNIFLLLVILSGVAISLIAGSSSCNNITPFVETLFAIENYYFGIIGIIIIVLSIRILIDKISDFMKHFAKSKNYIAAKHGRDYVFIAFLFLLATLMYLLSTPTCTNSLLYS